MTSSPATPRKDRLRRVVILCCSFARNLAYYRVGWAREHRHLLDPVKSDHANFWRTVNGNFVDTCVLEWCKLFADKQGKHYWGKIVTDPAGFKAGLLSHLGLDEGEFQTEINDMLRLRDKHIAHSDSDPTGYIPELDVSKKAVWFYYDHIVSHEAKPADLAGLPLELDAGYKECEDEAKRIYSAVNYV